ncbi:Putative Cell division protein kinase [Aspergillus calidoustus]|uniref:cyclin-dependent kinase n=1 Tax=Aspergillus calidoustus TaxID=454130 RepID=A0A0U5GCN6_ASPCI|nr:Putative Cell division protein kinase [Aspergillus calidoustus]
MEWKKALGFTDRLKVIQSLTTAHQRASSSAAFIEAQNQARRLESEAYDQATSKEAYELLCQKALDAAEDTVLAQAVPGSGESDDDLNVTSWESDESIGKYEACLHHFDGLHSTIYKAKGDDGTLVALKITVPHLLEAPHDAKREVQLLRQAASDHVIPLLETFKLDGGRFVLVFPFKRHDFETLLRRDMLTAAQSRSVLRDMFSALRFLHKLGIIHRDIKPANILFDSRNGPAYLADFGIAWHEGGIEAEPADKKITDVGTTCYRPPEVLFGFKGYGTALDLWAAGCVVAEAVTVGHHQLFDAGPVGSDLSLIQSIFTTLGTPDQDSWSETNSLPDWGKIEFYKYPAKHWDEILPGSSSNGRDLVSKLVCYESGQRISAEQALQHPYFSC